MTPQPYEELSPSEIKKLLENDELFKTYMINQLGHISVKVNNFEVCDSRVDVLTEDVTIIKQKIVMVERIITVVVTIILGALGYTNLPF